jgi:hypothetical protein
MISVDFRRLSLLSSFPVVVVVVALVISIMDPQQAQAQLHQQHAQLQQQQQQLSAAQVENEQLRQRLAQLEAAAAVTASNAGDKQAEQQQNQSQLVAQKPILPSSSIKAMAPSSFNGSVGMNPEQWLQEMERYLRVSGVDDNSKVLLASTYLKGGASVWFNTLDHREQQGDWDQFCALFRQRFSPLDAARVARATLRKLRQRRNVAEYSTAFLRQIELIPDMSVADQLDHYINGLHSRLADAVDRAQPKTLQAAMNEAQREELRQATRYSHGPTPARFQFYQPRATYQSSSYSDSDSMDLSLLEREIDVMYAEEQGSPSTTGQEHLFAIPMHRTNGPTIARHPRNTFRQVSSPRSNRKGVPGLTREEFDKLSRENRCFACKQPGHLARNCSKNPNNSGESKSSNQSSASGSNSSK